MGIRVQRGFHRFVVPIAGFFFSRMNRLVPNGSGYEVKKFDPRSSINPGFSGLLAV